ncbi:hypothetical protein AAFF_G00087180 [Aldrovandia affinis]|uniref:Uncharacterized protein n=1 Tax=Aldrovandia affinis TaxID=143900 RepID=A0AAD7RWJ0_9TELE|nr:hypothetical protein AAFF_G00087180 [Aldrovandia affinis]
MTADRRGNQSPGTGNGVRDKSAGRSQEAGRGSQSPTWPTSSNKRGPQSGQGPRGAHQIEISPFRMTAVPLPPPVGFCERELSAHCCPFCVPGTSSNLGDLACRECCWGIAVAMDENPGTALG